MCIWVGQVGQVDRTVDGVPEKNHTSFHDTTYFVNPQVIKSHPAGFLVDSARLDIFPETRRLAVLNTTKRQHQHTENVQKK